MYDEGAQEFSAGDDERPGASPTIGIEPAPRPTQRPSSVGALIFALLLIGIVVLAQTFMGPDDVEDADPLADALTAASSTEPQDSAVTTQAPTTTTIVWPAEDPAAPVMAPARAPVPMPSSSQFANVALRVEPTIDISNLTGMVWNQRLGSYYAITQDGRVHRIDRELTQSEVVLDLQNEVTELEAGSERGLLGIAFDPRDGRMFLYFTDRNSNTNIVSMLMTNGSPDPGSRRQVLDVAQPGAGHKAGDLVFDANGNLFIAIGDGGGSRGRDAQDDTKLLGTIVRITPRLDGDGYDVPADNPFVGRTDARPEIWATGLRNPWQIWLDPASGDLYIGDVGEGDTEELNVIRAGQRGLNFGWPWYEGSQPYAIAEKPDGVEVTQPIFEYPHSEGVSIVGGAIYLGDAIPELRGAFVIGELTGPIYALGRDTTVMLTGRTNGAATTVVETPDGELLFTTLSAGILRLLPG